MGGRAFVKTVHLIRHGLTQGNREKRYIGRTDEPLCPEGIAQIEALKSAGLPEVVTLFTSPYRRCVETAGILFSQLTPTPVWNLRECDFGLFEGKTAGELEHDAAYAAWLDSGCMGPIPGGESVAGFKARCLDAFEQAMLSVPEEGSAAFVIHGGCIMAIMEALALPKKDFYSYHVKNGGLISCAWRDGVLEPQGGYPC